jgi:hypothetical protein
VKCRRAVVVTGIPPRHATVVTVSVHDAPGASERGTAERNSLTLANAAPLGAGHVTGVRPESVANRTCAVAVSTVAEKGTSAPFAPGVTDPVTSNPLTVHRESYRTIDCVDNVSGCAAVSPTTTTVPVEAN